MKILALDFSTTRRSVALSEKGIGFRYVTDEARRGGSPFPLIERALNGDSPDALAIGLGPGSYTGIRSALAIAQGWNLSKGILAIGVSSAEAIAYAAWTQGMRGHVEVVIDAQRGEVYSITYKLADSGPTEKEPLEIRKTPRGTSTLIGPNLKVNAFYPTAIAVAALAAKSQRLVPPETLEAIYLRETSFVKAPAPRHS